MLQQRLTLELHQYVNRVDARVDQVTEDKIDNAVSAPEWNGRFCAFLRQRVEAGAVASGQYKCQYAQLHFMSLRLKGCQGRSSPFWQMATRRDRAKVLYAHLYPF